MSETLRFWLERIMTVEFWVEALSAFKDLGPLAPICLAFVESLIPAPVSYTHLRAHETGRNLVCRLLLEKKK